MTMHTVSEMPKPASMMQAHAHAHALLHTRAYLGLVSQIFEGYRVRNLKRQEFEIKQPLVELKVYAQILQALQEVSFQCTSRLLPYAFCELQFLEAGSAKLQHFASSEAGLVHMPDCRWC